MNYRFPYIESLSQVLAAIEGRKEFSVAQKDDYVVINYHVAMEDTFPPVVDEQTALLRECRGIIFKDGKVHSRRYHKFFNVGERAETSPQFVDLNKRHVILEKLDGSMVTPLTVYGAMRWGTKMGVTDVALPVEHFVVEHPEYAVFASYCMSQNLTPIFEWCSNKQRIVVNHPEDRLVLTAVRHNNTGEYLPYDSLKLQEDWKIEVVKAYNAHTQDIREFVEHTRALENTEGWVIRFDDGHMLKVKCDWYSQLHHAKDIVRFEKNVLEIVLQDKVDDLLPILAPEQKEAVIKYQFDVWSGIKFTAAMINETFIDMTNKMQSQEKREFAVHFVKNHEDKRIHPFLFKMWDGIRADDALKQELLKACSSQNRLDNDRWMMANVTFPSLDGNFEE